MILSTVVFNGIIVLTNGFSLHSKSCRKYKNKPCRYYYGRFFTKETIIAIPLANNLSLEEKSFAITNRNNILSKVKCYIDEFLDPSKPNYESNETIESILLRLGISDENYYQTLSLSSSTDYELHLKRPPNSCFINNYNPVMLLAWKASMDLRPVFNYYKAISYMCAYFSKSETESSNALVHASKEIKTMKMSARDSMYKLASAFATSRQISLQEAVSFSLPELWQRKCYPKSIFVNTNIPSKRIRMCKSEEEIEQMDPGSTDIFKRNMIERYIDRPDRTFCKGRYAVVNNLCLAMFLAYYYLQFEQKDENDSQPTGLDEDFNTVSPDFNSLPATLPLMSSKEKPKCRKIRQVLRYRRAPNIDLYPEEYAHHMLFLFYPFRNENELFSENSYRQKLAEPEVIITVNENKKIFEPSSDEINSALVLYNCNNNSLNVDQNETTKILEDVEDTYQEPVLFDSSSQSHSSFNIPTNLVSDDILREMIRSLNSQQRQVFDMIYSWAKEKIKYQNSLLQHEIKPIHLFLSGGAEAVTKILNFHSGSLEKQKVLKIAPTGVAAINIDGTTINTALVIPISRSVNLNKLSDSLRCTLRNDYSEVAAVIIDEISMVSNVRLYQIYVRLCEIFNASLDIPFGGLTLLVVGDFYQLPPVREQKVFMPFKHVLLNLCHPWHHFQFFELTEVMRQLGYNVFIDILNNVRVGRGNDIDIALLESRKLDMQIPSDATHLFAENSLKDNLNTVKLSSLRHPLVSVHSIDKFPTGMCPSKIEQTLKCTESRTAGLPKILNFKKNASIMLTNNIDIKDRLINGQLGTVFETKYDSQGQVETVYVKFNDQKAGLQRMHSDSYALQNNVVPIRRIELNVPIYSSGAGPSFVRTQFPLMLAWACTVHKVQGLTLDNLVVSFELNKQRRFSYGQIYVALSRAKKHVQFIHKRHSG